MADDLTIPLDLFPVVETKDKSETLRQFIVRIVEEVKQLRLEVEALKET